jgi:hypothetical protein
MSMRIFYTSGASRYIFYCVANPSTLRLSRRPEWVYDVASMMIKMTENSDSSYMPCLIRSEIFSANASTKR